MCGEFREINLTEQIYQLLNTKIIIFRQTYCQLEDLCSAIAFHRLEVANFISLDHGKARWSKKNIAAHLRVAEDRHQAVKPLVAEIRKPQCLFCLLVAEHCSTLGTPCSSSLLFQSRRTAFNVHLISKYLGPRFASGLRLASGQIFRSKILWPLRYSIFFSSFFSFFLNFFATKGVLCLWDWLNFHCISQECCSNLIIGSKKLKKSSFGIT